jgi:iron(III) transport system substrate-binding protein
VRTLPRIPIALLVSSAVLAACGGDPELVVYVAHDQVHSEPLIRRFEGETGLRVRAEYDTEANKTVGLVNRIREERNRTRADVFWNNEIANTVALAREGILARYESPSARDVPPAFRDPEGRWTGFAARARVFIVHTQKADPAALTSMWDLVDPKWAGDVAMARPLTGTTLTHAAALFDVLGEERALEYLSAVIERNRAGELDLTSGNAQVMRLAREGRIAFGWTDTDDFNVALEAGAPVTAVYPDQDGPDAIGTLLVPNTVAILAEAPHPEAARRFVDWLLRPEIEAELARSRAAQIPLRASVPVPEGMRTLAEIRAMEVDWLELGGKLVERQERLKELFLR